MARKTRWAQSKGLDVFRPYAKNVGTELEHNSCGYCIASYEQSTLAESGRARKSAYPDTDLAKAQGWCECPTKQRGDVSAQ